MIGWLHLYYWCRNDYRSVDFGFSSIIPLFVTNSESSPQYQGLQPHSCRHDLLLLTSLELRDLFQARKKKKSKLLAFNSLRDGVDARALCVCVQCSTLTFIDTRQ